MKQVDIEILLKDLCARLPYGVKVEAKGLLKTIADEYDAGDTINAYVLNGLNLKDYFKTYSIERMVNIPLFNRKGEFNIKPYLFPLSSMTPRQRDYIHKNGIGIDIQIDNGRVVLSSVEGYEWLNKNYFDYRGLIEKGLAIDATELNIY